MGQIGYFAGQEGVDIMSTLDATVSMLRTLPESELLTIYDLTRRFFIKQNKGTELETMTEDQILEKLDIARCHADEGRVMDADVAVSKLRMKYGL